MSSIIKSYSDLPLDIDESMRQHLDVSRPNEQRLSDAAAMLDEGTAAHGVR
jgi:predicted component of type VI protein secretion system